MNLLSLLIKFKYYFKGISAVVLVQAVREALIQPAETAVSSELK